VGNTDDSKLDPAVITGDTKKQQPTIIKINQGVPKNRSRSRASSSSSNNNPTNNLPRAATMNPHHHNGDWIQHQETQQKAATFHRDLSSRSSRSANTGSDAPPRPYKSPELSPYQDQRAFMNPKNQVLPSPGGSLPSSHRVPSTNYAT